jgi:hypothetical protein
LRPVTNGAHEFILIPCPAADKTPIRGTYSSSSVTPE